MGFSSLISRCLFKTPGTLTPECHTGTAVRHSRRGVNVILQILGDLLRAAYNQGGLLAHPHCLASSTTGSLLTTVDQTQGKGKTPQSQLAEQNNETSGVSFFLVIFSFVCFPPGIDWGAVAFSHIFKLLMWLPAYVRGPSSRAACS